MTQSGGNARARVLVAVAECRKWDRRARRAKKNGVGEFEAAIEAAFAQGRLGELWRDVEALLKP